MKGNKWLRVGSLNGVYHATVVGVDGLGWVCRMSTSGRGLRLHQTERPIGSVYPILDHGAAVEVCATAVEAVADYKRRADGAAALGASAFATGSTIPANYEGRS